MDIKLVTTQKVLSPTQISLADYVINPYRGCEFGCTYCYSQENKNLKDSSFFNCLGVKINAPQILEKELRYTNPKRVLLGSTTECFQYQETKYKITEQILELLNSFDIPYTILTKSHLITENIRQIEKNRNNKIYFTLNHSSDTIIRLFEKRSPLIKERIEALRQLTDRKIALRVHIGPFIPHLTPLKDILAIIPKEIKEVDIELYHRKMGNFEAILDIVEASIGAATKEKISAIYRSEENYRQFAQTLKEEARELNTQYGFKIFLLIPDFDEFYNPGMDYENSII